MPAVRPITKAAPAAPRARRRGFTLIELMVVLVIIIIVAGLVVVGITSAMSSTRDRATETRLQMLDGFLSAYANADNARAGGMGNTEAKRLPEVLKVAPAPPPDGFYSTVDSAASDTAPLTTARNPLTAPDPGATLPYLTDDPTRYPPRFVQENWIAEPAVARTQAVMRALLTVPANQSTYATIPEDAKTGITGVDYNGTASILRHTDQSATSPLDPPLMVDGHNNVIIFVPATGLTDLRFEDGTTLDMSNLQGQRRLIAANGRAFWASAGPDGDFAAADDNVYSTAVIRD